MAITSRTLLKEYCLRRLGHPVIEINVDEEQCDDRVDDALQYFAEYHFDGVEKVFLKHVLTAYDITNEYIPMDDPANPVGGPVISVIRVAASSKIYFLEVIIKYLHISWKIPKKHKIGHTIISLPLQFLFLWIAGSIFAPKYVSLK